MQHAPNQPSTTSLAAQPLNGLTAGLDWAKDDHAVCVVDGVGEVIVRFTVEHTATGLRAVVSRLATLGCQEIAIERPDGPVVDALLEAQLTVVVISPIQLKNLRSRYGSAGKKDDRFDAYVLADTSPATRRSPAPTSPWPTSPPSPRSRSRSPPSTRRSASSCRHTPTATSSPAFPARARYGPRGCSPRSATAAPASHPRVAGLPGRRRPEHTRQRQDPPRRLPLFLRQATPRRRHRLRRRQPTRQPLGRRALPPSRRPRTRPRPRHPHPRPRLAVRDLALLAEQQRLQPNQHRALQRVLDTHQKIKPAAA